MADAICGFRDEKMKYPKPKDDSPLSYGTAGFRMSYEKCPPRLESIVYRIGILAALRSLSKSASVGMMITASHNPECDNGVKLVDPSGEMLSYEWEKLATTLVNCSDEEISDEIEKIAEKHKISLKRSSIPSKSTIILGRDTRQSSQRLLEAAIAGIEFLGLPYRDGGILTTPQLHFLVRESNIRTISDDYERIYLDRFVSKAFVEDLTKFRPKNYASKLFVDCANGVGSKAVKCVAEIVRECGLDIVVRNKWNPETSKGAGPLNVNCGADFVKLHMQSPKIYDGPPVKFGERWISFDGDADRVIFYYVSSVKGQEKFILLDGDRIATLYASFFKELLDETGLSKDLSLGLVQTAYANGRSTTYIKYDLDLPVSCVPTGVKYLHAEAIKKFDFGIYFEANGHGTVTFSEKACNAVKEAMDSNPSEAIQHLNGVMTLVNEAVGDAVTDFLLVEHILACKGWDMPTWASQYTDLPVCQLKVFVKDRSIVKTRNAERVCEFPRGLQTAIDKLVEKVKSGRAFVRPSGTEDIVRVYAECEGFPDDARRLAVSVALNVYDLAGGEGPRPK